MFLLARPLGRFVLLVAFVPTNAVAQTVRFADLSRQMNLGDTVSVMGADGSRTKGRVTELTPSSLTLLVNEMERRTFPEATVLRIAVRDSLWDGALIGLAAGAVSGAVIGLFYGALEVLLCSESDNPARRQSCSFPSSGVAWGTTVSGGLGAAIGAGIDALRVRTIDVSRPQGARLTVSPAISTDRQAVLVSIRF